MKYFIGLLMFLFLSLYFALGQSQHTFVYDDKGARDPFFPLVSEDGRYLIDTDLSYSSDELKLSGILWDKQGNSSALINNQIVKVGETISGYEIRDITKNSVIILKDGKEYIIKLLLMEEKKEE